MREAAVALPEEAEHRHHAVDRRKEDARRLDAAGGEGLAERQEVDEDFEDGAGVAADVAAVGQDLADQFEVEPAGRLLEEARLVGHRQRGGGERDHDAQPRQAGRAVIGDAAKIADLPGQRAHEAAVEGEVAAVEDERRLRQPGDDAAGDDLRLPGDRVVRRAIADPFVDEAARIRARERHVGGAQMAQPAEAVQLARPVLARRLDVEDREAVDVDAVAGEDEAAGIDVERRRSDRRCAGRSAR